MTTTVRVLSVEHDGVKGTVTLESSHEEFPQAIMELKHGSARNLAITAAAKDGLPDPRCEISGAPYPVDSEGKLITDPHTQQIARYRIDVPVTRKLV